MAIQLQGNGGVTAEVDDSSTRALRAVLKPYGYGALGHYRVTHRVVWVASQAANSRLFEIRNAHASNLIVPTRLQIKAMQTANHTAAIEDSFDAFKCTSFSVVDTTNTTTPTPSVKRTSMGAFNSTNTNIRALTATGVAAGMTGGTLTKDSTPMGQLPLWLVATMPTAANTYPNALDMTEGDFGSHPFVFAQNEGLIVENRVALGAAAGGVVYIDLSWAEVTAF